MIKSNFWNDIEKGISNYLQKHLELFRNNYESNNEMYRDENIDDFVNNFNKKNSFELLYDYVNVEIEKLLDFFRKKTINSSKNLRDIDKKKINTLIELEKLFNVVVVLTRFLNNFVSTIKNMDKSFPIDLNSLFMDLIKLETDQLVDIYNNELKGEDSFIDKCFSDIKDSNDALEIWSLISQLGLFLRRDILLANLNKDEEEKKYNDQLVTINKIEQDFIDGKINTKVFNRDEILRQINDYHNFFNSLSKEKREDVSRKATSYYNKALPLVNILQYFHDLLISILKSAKIISEN